MISQDIPKSDERAVETGQLSQAAHPHLPKAETIGYFEPHQMAKLAENGRLYVVADSVGQAASGQLAAQYAVKKILRSFYTNESPDLQARLLEAIQQANQDIRDRNRQHPERRPLATYVTAVLIHDNKLLAANAGDGQVYVVWEEDIECLTSASNRTAEKVTNDQPAEADGAGIEEKTALPQASEKTATSSDSPPAPGSSNDKPPVALGLAETVEIATFSRRLFAGDTVVICSGGLTGYVAEKEIAEAISLHAPNQAIKQLTALAAERGNRGHLAISVTRVLSSPAAAHSPMPMVMPTPPKWSDWEISSKPQTRPMSKPIPATPAASTIATRPMSGPKRKSKPVEIPLKTSRRWPWRSCLIVGLILIVLCALPILIWRFLLPPNVLAAVPFLGQVNITVREEDDATGLDELETEGAVSGPAGQTTPNLAAVEVATATPPAAQPGVAASGSSPLPTPTAAPAPVLTPTLAVTPTPALPPPTATPTLAPTIDLPANCENRARFVTDVTVEDGTEFPPQREFEKIWQLRNEGTCPWGPGYTIRYTGGDFFGADREIPLVEVVSPDEEGNIGAPMIAPAEPGSYRGVWQLHDLTGEPFGPTIYLEIEVVSGAAVDLETAPTGVETLYDFVANAGQATWSAGAVDYAVQEIPISDQLELSGSDGLVAVGVAELRGNRPSDGPALLTYPHQELGFIQGDYVVETPLQPGDALAATLGFTRLSILSDDGVTFEVSFTPDDSTQVVSVLSQAVQYADSPVTQTVPLNEIEAGQTGVFTLRVLSGDSASRDWALWIDAQLVRP